MGEEDIRRQRPNVVRMRMLGAEVIPVSAGAGTLKDAMNEAIRDWITNVETTHYLIGSAAGPHPYPALVRDLQAVIGREAREQMLERGGPAARPGRRLRRRRVERDRAVPPVRRRRGRAAAGRRGRRRRARHRGDAQRGPGLGAARLAQLRAGGRGRPGAGDPLDLGRAWTTRASAPSTPTSRTSAGPSTRRSPTPRRWRPSTCCATREGIIPALESSHALWLALDRAQPGELVLVGLSGRGDKDVDTVDEIEGGA